MDIDNNNDLKILVTGVYKIRGVGDVVTGYVLQGTVSNGDRVKFISDTNMTHCMGTIMCLDQFYKKTKASAGETIGMTMVGLSSAPMKGDIMVRDTLILQ